MRALLLLLLFPSTSSSTYLHVCMYLSVCLCGWVCGCFLSRSLFHFKSPILKRAETRFSLSSPLCPRLLSLPPPVSLSVSVSNLSVLPSTRKKTKIYSEPPKLRKKNSNFVDYITNPLTLPQWNNNAATKKQTKTHTHSEMKIQPTPIQRRKNQAQRGQVKQ